MNKIILFKSIGLLVLYSCTIIMLSACKSESQSQALLKAPRSIQSQHEINIEQTQNTHSHYDINSFTKVTLNKKLVEISGLSMSPSGMGLMVVNDEKGNIYELDFDGEILDVFDFGKSGDYEGIEVVDRTIYVLKSNGKIVEYDLYQDNNITTHDNPLSLTNDTEGLGYDDTSHRLLIACKGSPNIKNHERLKNTKAVYEYDLKKDKLLTDPLLSISDDDISDFMTNNYTSDKFSKKKLKKLRHRAANFSPSAIAKNPRDGHYYIVSTQGKVLIIVNSASEIKEILFLDNKAYLQPEGICFDRDGRMYISNEGKGLKANILIFENNLSKK